MNPPYGIIVEVEGWLRDLQLCCYVVLPHLQIKADIECFKSQGVEMEEKRKEILHGLEAELAATEERMAVFDARYASAIKVLDQLKSGKLPPTISRPIIVIAYIPPLSLPPSLSPPPSLPLSL